MSREIKFRAWDGEGMFLQGDANSDEFWFGVGAEGLQLVLVGQRFEMGSGVAEEYSVPTDTDAVFMQYTGLKDRNGVEIYEGDLIFDESKHCAVQWASESAGWSCVAECGYGFFLRHATLCAVVGNIHENPELLEQPQ